MSASFPEGHMGAEVWGTLNSRLDAGRQNRMDSIYEVRDSPIENIWIEMDKIMLSLHPTHT